MAGRGSMNKDVSIRYTGDDKDFKKAAARVNVELRKQAAFIETENKQMQSSFDKTNLAAASMIAVFAVGTVATFFKNSIKLASDFSEAGGDVSSQAKITLGRLEDISLEWEAIKIQIGESILEGEGLFKIVDKIGKLSEKIRKHGFMAGLFVKQSKLDEIDAEKAMWDVDRHGNPLPPESGRRTLTEIKEQLKAAKDLEKAEKERAAAAEKVRREAEKELALREKLGKEYEKLFMKVNIPDSFEAWGKAQQKSYGGLASGPTESINNVTNAMKAQAAMVENLAGVFEGMFLSIDKGFKGMVESLIGGIKKLVTEMIAKAAVLMLLRTLFPMSFGVDATTELMGMFGSKPFLGGGSKNPLLGMAGSQNINIGGKFVLRGADAYAMVGRYGNMLNGST